jgi:hypothetical protein
VFVTALVLLVLAALANTGKLIYMLKLAGKEGGEGLKRITVPRQLSTVAFALGVVAFVMEKYLISVVLFAVSILAGIALAVIVRRQPDSTDVSR